MMDCLCRLSNTDSDHPMTAASLDARWTQLNLQDCRIHRTEVSQHAPASPVVYDKRRLPGRADNWVTACTDAEDSSQHFCN